MVEIWQIFTQHLHHIVLRRLFAVEHRPEPRENSLHLLNAPLLRVLHDTQIHKLRLVLDVTIRIKLLEGLFATRIAPKELARIARII